MVYSESMIPLVTLAILMTAAALVMIALLVRCRRLQRGTQKLLKQVAYLEGELANRWAPPSYHSTRKPFEDTKSTEETIADVARYIRELGKKAAK